MKRPPTATGASGEPDWATLIREELDSYRPQRLPERFVPGRRRRLPVATLRPLAVAAALVVALGLSALAGGTGALNDALHQSAGNLSQPGYTPAPSASSGVGASPQPTQAGPSGAPTPVAGAGQTAPSSSQSQAAGQAGSGSTAGQATPTPTPAPGILPSLPVSPPPVSPPPVSLPPVSLPPVSLPPLPLPTPSPTCLPLNLICT